MKIGTLVRLDSSCHRTMALLYEDKDGPDFFGKRRAIFTDREVGVVVRSPALVGPPDPMNVYRLILTSSGTIGWAHESILVVMS